MNAGYRRLLATVFVCLSLLLIFFLTANAMHYHAYEPTATAPGMAASPTATAATGAWTLDQWADLIHGSATGVAIEAPGQVQLDMGWWPDVRVNDPTPNSKFEPRATWVVSGSGGLTATVGLIAWADERQADHSPDIYVAHSVNGGRSWLPNVMVHDGCDPDDPPYPECPGHYSPDVAVRSGDNSLWIVWQQEEAGSGSDPGNIYYARSGDAGTTWPDTGVVTTLGGKQQTPRLASDGTYLFSIWEDESADAGDLYVARFNPATDAAWSAPFQIGGDSSGAEQRSPALAVDGEGNLYATWVDYRTDDDGEVYFARWLHGSTWSAGDWSTAVRLSGTEIDWADRPDIQAAPDGMLYATWMERVPTGPATYDFQIVVARSTDQGINWTGGVVHRLTGASATNAFYQAPALGATFAGRLYVTWLHSPDAQAATSTILEAVSFDQGRNWGTPRPLSSQATVAADSRPSIAVAADGKALVAWQDFRLGSSTHIFATAHPSDRRALRGEYAAIGMPGGQVTWGTLVWTATVPANTGLTLYSRVLVNAAAGWTNWLTHTQTGALAHPAGEAIQVRAVFTSTGFDSAILDGWQVTYQRTEHVYLPVLMTAD